MEIVLAVAGFVLAVIALPWLKGPVEKQINKIRIKLYVWKTKRNGVPDELSKVQSIRYGLAENYTEDFMFCNWHHEVKVNINGDSTPSIECELVNVSEEIQTEIHFPLYVKFDYKNKLKDFHIWAKIRSNSYIINLEEWDSKTNSGIVKIPFPYPLKPRDDIKIKWGYHCNTVYDGPGNHWFEWYIARPHSYFRIKYIFDKLWIVSNVKGTIVGLNEDTSVPVLKGNQISWFVKGPRSGYKYHLSWTLDKK